MITLLKTSLPGRKSIAKLLQTLTTYRLPKWATMLTLATLALIWLVPTAQYIELGRHVRYVADDWDGLPPATTSIWHDWVRMWHLWCGRYSWVIWMDVQDRLTNRMINYVAIMVALFYASICYMLRAWLPWRISIPLTLAIGSAEMMLSPSINDAFFWQSSTNQYLTSLIGACLVAGKLVRATRLGAKPLDYVIVTLGVFVTSGFNEDATICYVLLLGAAFIWYFRTNAARLLCTAFFTCLVCFVELVTAPGNHVRAVNDHFALHHNIVHVIVIAFQTSSHYLAGYSSVCGISMPSSLDWPRFFVYPTAAILVPILLIGTIGGRSVGLERQSWQWLLKLLAAILFCGLGCVYLTFVGGAWAFGGDMFPRIKVFPTFALIMMVASIGYLLGRSLPQNLKYYNLMALAGSVVILGCSLQAVGTMYDQGASVIKLATLYSDEFDKDRASADVARRTHTPIALLSPAWAWWTTIPNAQTAGSNDPVQIEHYAFTHQTADSGHDDDKIKAYGLDPKITHCTVSEPQ